jgi:hypothetical protein
MKNEVAEKKLKIIKHNHTPLCGITSDKYAILLDEGKTIVFISDKSKEAETRLKYKLLGRFSKI